MKQYLDLLERIKNEGVVKSDRTGTGTKSIFGHQMKFDLRDGFPMLTTKKLHLKSIVHELLWFLNGDTSNQYLRDNGVRIWNEWSSENQTLGKVYGYQFRKLFTVDYNDYEIAERMFYEDNYEEKTLPEIEPVGADDLLLKDKTGSIYKVLCQVNEIPSVKGPLDSSEMKYYKIQYQNNGYTRIVSETDLRDSNILNPYEKMFYEVGYLGEVSEYMKDTPLYSKAFDMWLSMLSSCYDPESDKYNNYGEDGIIVCKRWHNFSNFLKDLPLVYGFYDYMKDDTYTLDVFMFGSRVFAPETTIFIPYQKHLNLVYPQPIMYDGKLYLNAYDLDFSDDMYSDSKAESYVLKSSEVVRYKFKKFDQIQNCIDLIKNDPSSRRILVCAWSPEDLGDMALTPCHCLFQFYVAPDENGVPTWLDLQLYQRSCDSFLGVPFNIASYSLLCMMMAQVCGLKPRYFIHSMGDTHLYLDHLEQADLQLSREPRELPKMKINPDVKDLFSFKYEDFELTDYNPHPHIAAKVSV